jgi:hypothetical protein
MSRLTNDFQIVTNRILAYTLIVGFEEFLLTYYDLVDFYNTTSDPLRTIVVRETFNDPEAPNFILSRKGVFLEYLMCHCTQESNELIRFTSTMELERDHTSTELQQESDISVHDGDISDEYDNNKDMLLREAVSGTQDDISNCNIDDWHP